MHESFATTLHHTHTYIMVLGRIFGMIKCQHLLEPSLHSVGILKHEANPQNSTVGITQIAYSKPEA